MENLKPRLKNENNNKQSINNFLCEVASINHGFFSHVDGGIGTSC